MRIQSGEDWAEDEYDHDSAKESICSWDCAATFGATFPDGDGTGAADVEVCVAECNGYWYLSTRDDAGGSDDCDATPYGSEKEAREAARDYAEEHDECDALSAKDWLVHEKTNKIEAGKSDDGEWVLAHKDGSRWDDDRYSDKDAAETAIDAWYEAVQSANPGTNIIWHLMDTPELARLNEDGEIEMASAEND